MVGLVGQELHGDVVTGLNAKLLVGALFVGLGHNGDSATGRGDPQADQVTPTASASPAGDLTMTIRAPVALPLRTSGPQPPY